MPVRSRTLRTWGDSESGLAERLADHMVELDAAGPRAPTLAFLASGIEGLKVRNARARPATTVVARAGFEWVTVEGRSEVIGPDDPHPAVDAGGLRLLLRDVFTAAGGTHDDWEAYDRTMADERRAAVLVTPHRIYGVTR